MAEFESKIYRIDIESHPNADRLDLAVVGDYRCIVGKDDYKTGDYAAYIPEGSVVPEDVIKELGLEGRLAGAAKNRVKAIKLRGVLSQGLIYPIDGQRFLDNCPPLLQGDDVTKTLGLIKYEPPIPVHMNGQVDNNFGRTIKYDIENIKKYPDVLASGEAVIFSEKLHGTWACFGWHYDADSMLVASKGQSAAGRTFKLDAEENKNNLYVRMYKKYENQISDLMDDIMDRHDNAREAIYVLGEIYGPGVQDLRYGEREPAFRVFDIYVGSPGQGRYLDAMDVVDTAAAAGLKTVPLLYMGPYSKELLDQFTNGTTVIQSLAQAEQDGESQKGTEIAPNIREGIVIKPTIERRDDEIGRVILKSVSEKYLLRKGGTELN